MPAYKKIALLALAAVLAGFGSREAAAFPNEPDGFAGAKFGMPVERVREIFPELVEVTSQPGIPWAFYTLDGQSYAGLNPCKVTLGFFDHKLYEAKLDCGRDKKVRAALFRRFGEPSAAEGDLWIWRSDSALVSMNRKAMTFALVDPKRSRLVHEYLLRLVLTREFEAREKQTGEVSGDQPAKGSP